MHLDSYPPALLMLDNGMIFHGVSIGTAGSISSELIFTTAMTGYQETLTDPSYAGQTITFTAPHIGAVGCNDDDIESPKIWADACLMGHIPLSANHWREETKLIDFLKKNNCIALANIDTRRLTQIIREHGSLMALITTDDIHNHKRWKKTLMQFDKPDSSHWIHAVSTPRPVKWHKHSWSYQPANKSNKKYKIAVLDFGVKQSILNKLNDLECDITRYPHDTKAQTLIEARPDGILLSNGPGDPRELPEIVNEVKQLIDANIPILGICLGIQLLALAFGAQCYKLKFGQHGANHPVAKIITANGTEQSSAKQAVHITLQNHNYAVDEQALPVDVMVTHRSLFDNSVQGIQHKTKPIIAFQGHPEANPGPHDAQKHFDEWVDMLAKHKLKDSSNA
jgi:carbamoyl-phosphate synthase small subunit